MKKCQHIIFQKEKDDTDWLKLFIHINSCTFAILSQEPVQSDQLNIPILKKNQVSYI